jgi:Skp family chaperone for outer membrane proteins
MMIALMMLVAGCATKQVQETKPPQEPQVGIIDINKAVKAHPKYNQLQSLAQEANTMEAQVEAQRTAVTQRNQDVSTLPDEAPQGDMTELDKAFQQQFKDKMSAKEKEVNTRLTAKENAVHQTLSDEMKAYSDQIDKEYQPQIFNLQLKLKTVQLSKEDTASLQGELETLQTQQADKLAAKQKELSTKMDEMLAPDKAAAEQELQTYSKQVNEDISKQATAKQAEIAARATQQLTVPSPSTALNGQAATGDIEQQLVMKQQEVQALQDSIIEDIKDKTSKIAIERGLEAVLTNVTVNVSGVDITDAVIAACNK